MKNVAMLDHMRREEVTFCLSPKIDVVRNVTAEGLHLAGSAIKIRAMKCNRATIVLMTIHRRWAV